jgi:hypothetical protein
MITTPVAALLIYGTVLHIGGVFEGLLCSLWSMASRFRGTFAPSIFTSNDQAMKLASP